MKSSIAQAALCVFTSLCVVNELPVLFADFHDHLADLFSFARMVREEFIRFCEQHMTRVPGAYHQPSSAEPSPPSSPPRPTSAGKRGHLRRSSPVPPQRPAHVVASGCIVNNVEELKSWMLNILPLMLAQGRRCDMRVFREIQRTVEEEPPGKRHTVAIIPVDD